MKTNIANVKAAGADTVVSSCPACDMMWRQVYPIWAEKVGIDYGITGGVINVGGKEPPPHNLKTLGGGDRLPDRLDTAHNVRERLQG